MQATTEMVQLCIATNVFKVERILGEIYVYCTGVPFVPVNISMYDPQTFVGAKVHKLVELIGDNLPFEVNLGTGGFYG